MDAMRALEQTLRARLGTEVCFALIVASLHGKDVGMRRLSNCSPELTQRLYKLAQLAPFAPDDVSPWSFN